VLPRYLNSLVNEKYPLLSSSMSAVASAVGSFEGALGSAV
jgi:hypothetical protein